MSIVDSLSYKIIGIITLWVYLDNLLFTENWKLITENTVIKYFLKGKILFTCYCSHIFVHWLVHEQCHETRKKRKRSFNADALLNKHTLYICFFFFLGALMTSSQTIAIVLIWINSRIGLSHPFFVYFPGAFKLVYRLAYVGISYTYIFNKAIHMRNKLRFRPICWCIWDQHPHIRISLLFLFTEYMLW